MKAEIVFDGRSRGYGRYYGYYYVIIKFAGNSSLVCSEDFPHEVILFPALFDSVGKIEAQKLADEINKKLEGINDGQPGIG